VHPVGLWIELRPDGGSSVAEIEQSSPDQVGCDLGFDDGLERHAHKFLLSRYFSRDDPTSGAVSTDHHIGERIALSGERARYSTDMSSSTPGVFSRLNASVLSIGAHAEETVEERGRRRVMVGALAYSLPLVLLSASGAEESWVAVGDLIKAFAHVSGLLVLRWSPRSFRPAFRGVFAADIISDVLITVVQGGLYLSGLQVGWSLIVVLGALVSFSIREAVYWFGVFVVAVIVAVGSSSFLDPRYRVAGGSEADGAFTIVVATALVFLVMAYFVRQRNRYQRQSDNLLHSILPAGIAEQLKTDTGMIADQFDDVTVLFADVVDFTPMSATMNPRELVGLLNEVFTDIDRIVEELGLEKIKTVGDEYMVAAGVPIPRPDHAHVIADLALRIRDHVATREFGGHQVTFRMGINSGSVVAGIIGQRKFAYDLWGDVVNTASRMESHGSAGRIQIPTTTHALVKDEFLCERRGEIDVKGKGRVETWFVNARRPAVSPKEVLS
jgi:guanylate cyclase